MDLDEFLDFFDKKVSLFSFNLLKIKLDITFN